ncbi:hypothetical protein D3C78_1845410 [compost metagenome]
MVNFAFDLSLRNKSAYIYAKPLGESHPELTVSAEEVADSTHSNFIVRLLKLANQIGDQICLLLLRQ